MNPRQWLTGTVNIRSRLRGADKVCLSLPFLDIVISRAMGAKPRDSEPLRRTVRAYFLSSIEIRRSLFE